MDIEELKQELVRIESSIKTITGDNIEYMTYWWRRGEKCVQKFVSQQKNDLKRLITKC